MHHSPFDVERCNSLEETGLQEHPSVRLEVEIELIRIDMPRAAALDRPDVLHLIDVAFQTE